MRDVVKIINQIASVSSIKEKENILRANKDNQLLKDILYFVFNSYITTGINNKKINKNINLMPSVDLNIIEEAMNYLKVNNTGRDIDIINIQSFIKKHNEEELQHFIKNIVTKELKIGMTATSINKVVPNFIPTFNVMLAKNFEEYKHKIKGDFVITQKLDGNRLVVIKENGNIKSYTRQGKLYEGLEEIEHDFIDLPFDNIVFDGELIAGVEGNTHEIYAETVSIARKKESNKKGLYFYIFDMLPLNEFQKGKSKENCIVRKNKLSQLFTQYSLPHCREVKPLYIGDDLLQVNKWMKYAIQQGWEGLMVNLDAPYECKRTDNILKVKSFKEADVRVIGIVEGTGKNKNKLGAINIQFEYQGQLYECNCGSGFSDEEREFYWRNPELIINKIVTISYFEISKNKDDSYGLRFPTWKGIVRHDKDEMSMH